MVFAGRRSWQKNDRVRLQTYVLVKKGIVRACEMQFFDLVNRAADYFWFLCECALNQIKPQEFLPLGGKTSRLSQTSMSIEPAFPRDQSDPSESSRGFILTTLPFFLQPLDCVAKYLHSGRDVPSGLSALKLLSWHYSILGSRQY
jgi:hypothetical protein